MKLRVVGALTILCARMLAAQTTANWTVHDPQNSPPARQNDAMAYDSAHSQVVLFGGEDKNGNILSDTWVWDGSDWTQKSPQTTPPARYGHAMAYDTASAQTVMFGGNDGNIDAFEGGALKDTWVWDGSNWTQMSPKSSPSPRFSHAMAYDSERAQVVLFAGELENAPLDDTWVWDGSNWTRKSPQTSPPQRYAHAMAYNSALERVLLFGGIGGSTNSGGFAGIPANDTWVWDGSNWAQISPLTSPSARSNHAMAYNSALGQIVLFGGVVPNDPSATFDDTWVWEDSNWTQEFPQITPPQRAYLALVYDSGHSQVLMFGGANSAAALNDTWTYGLASNGPAISGVVSASAFGGFSAAAPGSWVEIYGSSLAPDAQGWTSADFMGNDAPTSLNHVSVSIGGQAAFVEYISATQVNAQLPSNIATGGALPLTVTNANGTSAAFNLNVNPAEPGLLAPTSFKVGTNQYMVAQHVDGTYVLPVGAIAGVNSRPAQPGETIIVYGIGFGSVIPSIPAGEIVRVENELALPFQVLFSGTAAATPPYFGLAPGFVGLYQFNVVVPQVANSDLVALTFNLGAVAGAQTLFTAVHE